MFGPIPTDFPFIHVLLFIGAAAVLWGCLAWSSRAGCWLGGILVVASVIHGARGGGGLADILLHGVVIGLSMLVPYLFTRARQSLAREFARRQASLEDQRAKIQQEHETALKEKNDRQDCLERLQNRFALVQVMATKLEAGEILQTLGHMWRKRPGVRGCLLLRRQVSGAWGTAFTDGHFHVQDWLRVLGSHPSLVRSRSIRRYDTPTRQLTLPGQTFGSSCLLVPFTWDKDVLALGIIDVDPARVEECTDGFNIERKIVSIGLRRADLYDLMTERSRFDALTGAFLRRSLMERLEEGLRKSHRYNTPLFFALMDIDHFKALNDRWGHLVGDKALVSLANLVRKLAPPGVTLGRFGGDEFALVFETESISDVTGWFDRLRGAVAEIPLRDRDAVVRFSVSAGVSAYLPERPPVSELMAQADHALYQAKRGGRDRVVVWQGSGPKSSSGKK